MVQLGNSISGAQKATEEDHLDCCNDRILKYPQLKYFQLKYPQLKYFGLKYLQLKYLQLKYLQLKYCQLKSPWLLWW